MHDLLTAARQSRAWACYDCGKCTATCPIARAGGSLSPRRHVLKTNASEQKEILQNGTLFSCLTCRLCDHRCPAQVAYIDWVQRLRALAFRGGVEPECPHGGALQSLMRMMARGGTQQNRLGWLTDEFRTEREKGEVFYWTGCTPYYDAFFADFPVATLNGTRRRAPLASSAAPVVSQGALLWTTCCGTAMQELRLLARHNVQPRSQRRKTLVTSCANVCGRGSSTTHRFSPAAPAHRPHRRILAEQFGNSFKGNGKLE